MCILLGMRLPGCYFSITFGWIYFWHLRKKSNHCGIYLFIRQNAVAYTFESIIWEYSITVLKVSDDTHTECVISLISVLVDVIYDNIICSKTHLMV